MYLVMWLPEKISADNNCDSISNKWGIRLLEKKGLGRKAKSTKAHKINNLGANEVDVTLRGKFEEISKG